MAQTPMNLLYLFTDQHSKFITGCYGNPYVYTPNLDRLAGRGVRFTNAYKKPSCLFVGFVCPHFPWKVPPEIMKRYEPYEHLPRPIQWDAGERPMHPAIVKHRRELFLEEMFSEEEMRQAVAAYYGMTTFVDSQIGIVLDALKAAWLEENTRIIYTDDHGDSVGDHGLFFKHTMYEGSVGVPMLMAGPDLPRGITVDTCVSLLDIFPTVLDNFGLVPGEADRSLPGKSLFRVIGGDREERSIFAESHCIGFDDSVFMLRYRQYKYVYYAGGYEPQLFDLAADPHECRDLAGYPAYQEVRRMLDAELKKIADPEALSARAKQEQWDHMMAMGGKERAMGQLMAYSPTPKV